LVIIMEHVPPVPTRYFATFNEDGYPTGFYPDDVWPEDKRPAEAIEISAEQQRLFQTNMGYAIWQDGDVVLLEMPELP
jgi:hypothetical protein